MEKILFELKPNIIVAIIPTMFLSIIIAGIISFLARGFGLISAIVVFLVIFVLLVFFTFMNLRARRYVFYSGKTEFYEGFLNIIQRTVRYDRVTDCILNKTVWDRMFGTGTIRLITAGHEGSGSHYGFSSGIAIQYIKNPDQIYSKLQELLKKH